MTTLIEGTAITHGLKSLLVRAGFPVEHSDAIAGVVLNKDGTSAVQHTFGGETITTFVRLHDDPEAA